MYSDSGTKGGRQVIRLQESRLRIEVVQSNKDQLRVFYIFYASQPDRTLQKNSLKRSTNENAYKVSRTDRYKWSYVDRTPINWPKNKWIHWGYFTPINLELFHPTYPFVVLWTPPCKGIFGTRAFRHLLPLLWTLFFPSLEKPTTRKF